MKLIKDMYELNLSDKSGKNYKEYWKYQNSRSGGPHNHNQVFKDLYEFIPDDKEPSVKTNFGLSEEDYIIDVGCRGGQMIEYFHESGFKNTYGFDIGDNAEKTWDEIINEKYRKFLFKWDAHDKLTKFKDKKFKLITSSHLLEHCFDPKKVMENFHEMLSDDGILHTQFPFDDYDSWKKREHKPHYAYWKDENDWKEFLSECGFTMVWSVRDWRCEEWELRSVAFKTDNLKNMI
jgi:2-polyprenyl-3-methyl-5-hydroxy-6-metoxy-1,4-benzoquinol methylase